MLASFYRRKKNCSVRFVIFEEDILIADILIHSLFFIVFSSLSRLFINSTFANLVKRANFITLHSVAVEVQKMAINLEEDTLVDVRFFSALLFDFILIF